MSSDAQRAEGLYSILSGTDASSEYKTALLLSTRPSLRDSLFTKDITYINLFQTAPLMSICIRCDDSELFLRALIASGYDLNLGDYDTPLHSAASSVKPEILKMLLENGADPNLQDFNGDTALHTVSAFFHWEFEQDLVRMARVLLDNGANPCLTNN